MILEVVSVSAIAANKIVVEFNKEADEVEFVVKRGNANVAVKGTQWNAAGTVATLERETGKFIAGDYTVEVTVDEETSSFEIKIEEQKVTAIEFIGSDLIKAANEQTASFRYVVRDQYGDNMTKDANLETPSVSLSGASADLDPSKGTGRVVYDFTQNKDLKTVVVTLVHSATGTVATKTLNVADSANIASFEFGEIQLPEGTPRLTVGETDAVIEVIAKDQYGNVIDNPQTLKDGIDLISSDATVVFDFELDQDDNMVITIDAQNLTTDKTVVLTALVKANGNAYTKHFVFAKEAGNPHKIILGDVKQDVVAANDTDVVLEVTVVDEFGVELTAREIANKASDINSKISGVTGAIEVDRNSANYGKYVFAAGSKGTKVIVASTTAGVQTKTITVRDERILAEVVAPKTMNLIQGAASEAEFKFFDQYGAAIANNKINDLNDARTTALTYKLELTRLSGDADTVVLVSAPAAGSDVESKRKVELQAATNKTGSYRLTYELLEGAKVISSDSVRVNVVKNNVSGLTYSIEEIATLAGNQDYDAASPYAKTVKVLAKDAAGNSYTVNPADVFDVRSSSTGTAGVAKSGTAWKVFGKDITVDNTANKTATITAWVNTLDGVQTVSTEVTVSPANTRVTEIKVADRAQGSVSTTLQSGAKDKLTYVDALGANIYVITKDQYGVYKNASSVTIIVNSTNHAPSDAFVVVDGKLEIKTGREASIATGKDITATVIVGNQSKQITINLSTGHLNSYASGVLAGLVQELEDLITDAETLASNTGIGSDSGEVEQEDMDALEDAIVVAQDVVDADPAASIGEVAQAIQDLQTAIETFEAAIIE